MLHKILIFAMAAVLATGGTACKKKKPVLKPGELSVVEKDKLTQNAVKAYAQIVKDYPDSPHAAEAKQRMDALGGPAAAKTK